MTGKLRDAAELISPAVAETLAGLDLDPEHAAAQKLAQLYARIIDTSDRHCTGCDDPGCARTSTAAWAARWIGPLLLDTLEALGATPRARAARKGDKPTNAARSRLQTLRDAR